MSGKYNNKLFQYYIERQRIYALYIKTMIYVMYNRILCYNGHDG